MKKTMSLFLVIALCFGFALAYTENESPILADDLLMRVYRANLGAVLREKYASRLLSIREGDNVHTLYLEGDRLIDINPLWGGVRVKTGNWDYVVGDDGQYDRFVTFEAEDDPWQLLGQSILTEKVLGAEENGSTILITTMRIEPFDRAHYVRDCEIHTDVTVDAETLEIMSLEKTALLPGGEQDVFYSAQIENDAACPIDAARMRIQLYDHLWHQDSRTVSFVFNRDYGNEYRMSFVMPKGDDVIVGSYMMGGMEYLVDEEQSVYSSEDRSNDAVYYLSADLSIRRDCATDPTGCEPQVIEKIDYCLDWQQDFHERNVIDIGEDRFLNGSMPLKTIEEFTQAGYELYAKLTDAGIYQFEKQLYKYMAIWLSRSDGYVLYMFNYDDHTLGGDIAVWVDAVSGEVLACWPEE